MGLGDARSRGDPAARQPGPRRGLQPDGRRLAAGCADNSIRLWDVATARRAGGKELLEAEVAELRGHEDYVHAVAWSPDGTRLLSASGDHTVRVWDSLLRRSGPGVRPGNAGEPS